MKKIILKVLIGLVVIVFLFAGFLFFNGTCFTKFKSADKKLSSWMGEIENDRLISEIIMPGSHDAGTDGMIWFAETQSYSLKEQLLCGARYFDVRVNYHKGEYVIFHSIINGAKFIPILQDIKDFIVSNPTEVILLDFQHFKGDSQSGVYQLIEEYLLNNNLLVINDSEKSDLQFISELTLGEARGKCIIFWGDRSSAYAEERHVFLRNNDNCDYEGMSLNSYYFRDYHIGKSKLLIYEAYPKYYDAVEQKIQSEGHKGIFVLQAQLTDDYLIFGPWAREKQHDKAITDYIDSLKEKIEFKHVNVIMRDYLTAEKCEQIINLNF